MKLRYRSSAALCRDSEVDENVTQRVFVHSRQTVNFDYQNSRLVVRKTTLIADRHRISSIVFNHHQSAISDDVSFGDASSPKVRIDDAMSPIRDESRKRYARDAHFAIFRQTTTSRRKVSIKRRK